MGEILPLNRDPISGTPSPTLAERGDDTLLLLARGGLNAAFDELVRRHQRRALGVAGKYLGQPEVARDVAQSTFLEIYRALPHYQAHGRFPAYLYRILLNQCHQARRSQRYQERTRQGLGHEESASTLPDEAILARERRRELDRALDRLSPKLRSVIALRFGAELSYQEIAGVLQLPLGTVKRRLFDGLERLHQLMART